MLCEMTVWPRKMYWYAYRTPACRTPLSSLLPSKYSGSLANSKASLLGKICKTTQTLSGLSSQNGCNNSQQLQIATTSVIILRQSSFKYHNNQQGNFQNNTHIRIPNVQLKTDFLGGGHIQILVQSLSTVFKIMHISKYPKYDLRLISWERVTKSSSCSHCQSFLVTTERSRQTILLPFSDHNPAFDFVAIC